MSHGRKIAVIGLGYVDLPVAVAFVPAGVPVTGFYINTSRIEELEKGADRTREVEAADLKHQSLTFTSELAVLKSSDFFIVTVPTPIDEARRLDLGAMLAASRSVCSMLKSGDVVVYESTVYPGAVEEECVPVLEKTSGLTTGRDFKLAIRPSASIPVTSSIVSRPS